ncbi:fimbrillin family protein [Alistipes sp.]|uniref:fimbrillin family protein n=1 Tax=Alistipes sp. TaxID=1872444 RepID=UPI003AF1A7B6
MNRLFLAVLCGGMLCACTEDETGRDDALRTVVRTLRIEAAAPASRTQLAPNGYDVLWSPGDRIGVYVKSGDTFTTVNAPLVFEGDQAAAAGVFKGDITLAEGAADYTLYAYYPWSEQTSADATGIVFSLAPRQTQAAAGDSSHLGDSDFLVAQAVQSTTGDFASLLFRHAFAVVEVDLTGSGAMAGKEVASVLLFGTDAATVVPGAGTATLTGMANMAGTFSFDLTAGSANNTAAYTDGSAQINYCGVDFTTPPVLETAPLKAYVTINPADYSTGGGRVWVVVRTTDGYTATYTRPGLTISPAQMKVIRQEVASATAPGPVVDLSADGRTANCYVVSEPCREYAFDATVAGNGVITADLQAAIQRYEGRTLSAALTGGNARLLWQSNPYLIDPASVAYEGGSIRFALTERPTSLGGNAVIGLYADPSSDEALWSWHIWITDRNPAQLEALAETYVMYATYEQAYGPGAAVMMDRNLGAIYKEDGPYARSFRAPLFQWGRKDPFPWGPVVFDARNRPSNFISAFTPVQTTPSVGTTQYATAHPVTFIASTDNSSYDWYWGAGKGTTSAERNNSLWGNPAGYEVGRTATKTLFDPCPAGWKMPQAYVFTGFTRTGDYATRNEMNVSGEFSQGWNVLYDGVNSTYYPGVGYRYDEAGVFFFTTAGYYWTSSPGSASAFGARALILSATQIDPQFINPRGSGFPVRCQKE